MSTATRVPVEEYLGITEKPNREYRDGVLYPKAVPPKLHALIQKALILLLEKQGAPALPELTLRLSDSRYLIPDVTVAGDFPGPYPVDPVALCCEILSPEDRLGSMLAKCEEYHAWGVPFCWVIDPVKRAAWEYHSGGEPVRATEALRAGEVAIGVEELFGALDR